MVRTVEIRWRNQQEGSHFFLLRASPGGSAAGSVDVDLADVSSVDVAKWADPTLGTSCPMKSGNDLAVGFTVDDSVTALRLRFTVNPKVNGKSCEALTVVQRFTYARGKLVADRFQVPRYLVTTRSLQSDDPVSQDVPNWDADTSRVRLLFGTHPLIHLSSATVRVDTEFLDVTNLWWDLHFQRVKKNPPAPIPFSPWYLAPGCGARSSQMVVLVNTRSTPMVWFAAVPEAATTDLPNGTTIGGYVFFRPPGAHPFDYSSARPDGLADPVLGTTGMNTLCRYLLTGRTHAQKNSVSMLPDWNLLLGYVEKHDPLLTMDGALPCGMEESLHRSSTELLAQAHSVRVLLLPQRSNSAPGYGSIVSAGLPERVDAAIRLLWTRGFLGGPGQQLASGTVTAPQPPQSGLATSPTGTLQLDPDYWIGGYSRSGDTLWTALQVPQNRARVGRVIAFDPTGFSAGVDAMRGVLQARGKRGLRVFIIWSPYTLGSPPTQAADALRRLGAVVTVLPETGPNYFRMPPNPAAPWVEYIFGDNRPWTGGVGPMDKAGGWWHQIIAFAGEHLVGDPQNPGSVSFMHTTMRP